MKTRRRWAIIREYFGLKYLEAAISFCLIFCIIVPLLRIQNKLNRPQKKTVARFPKKILLYGAYGNQSVGDDSILQSILENLDPNKFEITISSYRPDLTRKVTKHNVIWQGRTLDGLFYMFKTLKTTDILVFGGGGVLETHNNSLTTTVGMMYKFSKVYLAKLMGVKVYCFAIGSNTKPYSRMVHFLVSTLLDSTDGISTRDSKSYAFIKDIRPNLEVSSLADPAMLLGSEISKSTTTGEVPKIGVNVMPYYKLLNGDKSKLKSIRLEIAKSIDEIITRWNADIFFVPMVAGDDTDEQAAIFELIQQKSKVDLLNPDYAPNKLMHLLANLDLFIGTRLHPNILAFNVNTPIVGIAYHDKIFSLFDHIQRPNDVQSIQNLSSEILLKSIEGILENHAKIKSEMLERQKELKKLAAKSFVELCEL